MKTMLLFFSSAVGMDTPRQSPPVHPAPPPCPPAPPPRPQGASCEGAPALSIGSFVVLKNLKDCPGGQAIVQEILCPDRVKIKTSLNTMLSIAATELDVIPQPRKVWKCLHCPVSAYWLSYPEDGWTRRSKGGWRCPRCSPGSRATSKSRSFGSAPAPKAPRVRPDSPRTCVRSMLAANGLDESSSRSDIKKVYRSWLLGAHPDKGGANSEFISVHEVWKRLWFS